MLEHGCVVKMKPQELKELDKIDKGLRMARKRIKYILESNKLKNLETSDTKVKGGNENENKINNN